MEELTLIDFIGQMINEQQTIEAGFKYATRWSTLRDDLKEECRKEAKKGLKNGKLMK